MNPDLLWSGAPSVAEARLGWNRPTDGGRLLHPIRTILHLDMDAFYASVEQLDHPEWAGRPVVVGADPAGGRGRGVVAACSYEARAYGIHSALPIGRAWALCPDAVFIRPRMRRYSELSRRVFDILRSFTDLVEPLSIDEAFLDVTGSARLFGDGPAIGRAAKGRILRELGLVASVGVAPNKFVAKVASDLGKPDGFVVVEPGEEAAFLAGLPLGRLWGVGPKTEARLRAMGLSAIGDLRRLRPEDLAPGFGSLGAHLWRLAGGEDERAVEPESEAKSVGAETTFDEDTADRALLRRTLLELAERVATRLRAQGFLAGGVTLKYRDEAFRTLTRASRLAPPSELAEELFLAASELLEGVHRPGSRVRLLGIAAGRLRTGAGHQLELFGPGAEDSEKRARLARTVDGIRTQFGAASIARATLVEGASGASRRKARA